MAEYYLEFGFVSRGGGKTASGKPYSTNSVAKAAYDSREVLKDEQTGQWFDYRYKGEAEWNGLFLPKDAPKWMRNRNDFWNALEEREWESTRPDNAVLSRTLKSAIPKEFDTEEKRLRFALDLGRAHSRQGYFVDLSIHKPEGASPNYHIHEQLCMREIDPNSEDGFGKKIRFGDNSYKARVEEMQQQKETFVKLAARHLERYGHQIEADRFRVSHLTLKKQLQDANKRGDIEWIKHLDREPKRHEGPSVHAMEKRGIRTRVGDINREIDKRNFLRHNGRSAFGLVAKGVAGKTFDVIGNAVESTFAPILTPRQKADGKWADRQKAAAAKTALWEQQRETEKALKNGLERD